MTYRSSSSLPSHSARRRSTRARPSSSPPSSSTPASNYSSSTRDVPSTRDYVTSGPAFEINRTVDITIEVSSSSTPAYSGYDVRNYAPPVTTTCYSTEPSSFSSTSSASTSSYQYNMCESISNFPNYSFNPPSSVDAPTSSSLSPPSSSFQGYAPSTSSATSTNYSYYTSEGYASDHYGSHPGNLGNETQGEEEEAEYQVPHAHPPSQVMLERFLTVDSEMDSLAYLARIAIRCGDVSDGEVPSLAVWER